MVQIGGSNIKQDIHTVCAHGNFFYLSVRTRKNYSPAVCAHRVIIILIYFSRINEETSKSPTLVAVWRYGVPNQIL